MKTMYRFHIICLSQSFLSFVRIFRLYGGAPPYVVSVEKDIALGLFE